MRLFDGVQLAFGPTTDNGFYYDMKLPRSLTEADFPAIEAEMAKLIKADEPFERIDEPRHKALELCRELGQDFKVEHIQEGSGRRILAVILSPRRVHRSLPWAAYPSAGAIGAFKVMNIAGAIGKGTNRANNCSGSTARRGSASKIWKNILRDVEEAKRRDHRVLGKQLELFTTNPAVGAGLILWLPKGAMVRSLLENFIREELTRRGYQAVYTPQYRPGRSLQDLGTLSVLLR